jgi:putative membrane protein
MPSEGRLHPLSFLFSVGGQLRQFLVPGLVLLVGAGSAGLDWQASFLLLLIPSTILAIIQSISFRYRFDESELVITTGLFFRNQRHVPYSRIQNINAVQNVFHQLLGVVEVRVETGGGDEPEARMSVLPVAALEEMRERVFRGRQQAVASAAPEAPPDARRLLLRLSVRDLMLYGFIESRGLVIVAAAFGLVWEAGFFDGAMDMVFGENASGRGIIRQVIRGLFGGGIPSAGNIALTVGAFIAIILVMRVLSMGWALIRLYGFELGQSGDDLRAEYGLLTRVMATMPVHRIQTVTIREGPLHRLFGRTSVRVDTAGGTTGVEAAAIGADAVAPIVASTELPQLLRELLPEVDLTAVGWNPVHPRGFRRALKGSVFAACLLTAPFVLMLRWWTLVLLALLLVWAYFSTRQYVRHLGWSLTDRAILFRSGWLWRYVSVARFAKIQAVTLNESPFDRRTRMGRVRVDTAGAGDAHRVDIPYLARPTAEQVFRRLEAEAARTKFRW